MFVHVFVHVLVTTSRVQGCILLPDHCYAESNGLYSMSNEKGDPRSDEPPGNHQVTL